MSGGIGSSQSGEGFAVPDYDELAELFLGGEGGGAESPQSEGASEGGSVDESFDEQKGVKIDGIEALILGHLPVRAGPWVGQYAGAVARESGKTVGLVRLTDGVVSLDLYGSGGFEGGAVGDIDEALRGCASVIERWIVQVQELDEPALACDSRVGAVTLLAGANEAAIVAAYRTIKGLSAARNGTGEGLPIGVAIMGADETQAQTAMARLRRASSVFLDREVALAATVSQMQTTGVSSVYSGKSGIGAGDLLERIHRARISGGGGAGPYPFYAQRGGEKEEETPLAEVVVQGAVAEAFEAHVGEGVEETREVLEVAPVARTDSGDVPDLETLLEGMFPFAARCPDDESVRLAIGNDGTLHLLRRDEDGKGVEPLVAVEAWARKHAKLLAMAAGGALRAGLEKPIRRHLFTATPKHVRHLLDVDADVHLLAPVEVEGKRGWYCTELN